MSLWQRCVLQVRVILGNLVVHCTRYELGHCLRDFPCVFEVFKSKRTIEDSRRLSCTLSRSVRVADDFTIGWTVTSVDAVVSSDESGLHYPN